MNIMFLVLNAGIGGHARSAATIGRAIAKHGHNVFLVAPQKTFLSEYASSTFIPISLNSSCRNSLRDLMTGLFLTRFIREKSIDVIHTFDLHSHLLGYFLGRTLKLPVLSTVCGGTINHRFPYPYTWPIIVFSQELKDILVNRMKFEANDVIIEPARIEIEDHPLQTMDKYELTKIFGIDPNKHLILMICRISLGKKRSILYTLQAVEKLAMMRDDFVFLLIGGIQNQTLQKNIVTRMNEMNQDLQRLVALTSDSLSSHAVQAVGAADSVIGVGRVCFEGMMFGKPALVVGEDGYAGILSPASTQQQVQEIIYHNFSGRNVKGDGRLEERTAEMVTILDRLLSDTQSRNEWGQFGQYWLKEHLDVEIAVETYTGLYQNLLNQKFQKRVPWWQALSGYALIFAKWIIAKSRTFGWRYTLTDSGETRSNENF